MLEECAASFLDLHIPDVVFTGIVNVKGTISENGYAGTQQFERGTAACNPGRLCCEKALYCYQRGNCRGLIEGEFDDWGRAGYIVPIMSASQMARAMVKMVGNAPKRRKIRILAIREFGLYDQSDIYQRYYQLYRVK